MPYWELVKTRRSWITLYQGFPSKTAGAGMSRGDLGCAMPRLPWWDGWSRAGVNQEVPRHTMPRLPWWDSSSWKKYELVRSKGMLHGVAQVGWLELEQT